MVGALIVACVAILVVAVGWDMPAKPVTKRDREGW